MLPDALPSGAEAPAHNIFFALYPPSWAADRIARYGDRLVGMGELRGRRVARERLHVSLNGLGGFDVRPDLCLEIVRQAIGSIAAPSFMITLDRVMSFDTKRGLSPRVLVGGEGADGVTRLHHAIHTALARVDLAPRSERRITPHLTLSREDRIGPEMLIEDVSWLVREFHLVDSQRRGAGRHHEILATWPLVPGETLGLRRGLASRFWETASFCA